MLEIYLNFKNEATEAITFYETVFNTKCEAMMTFGEAPANPEYPTPESWNNLVMNASMNIEGTYVMFSDMPDGMGVNLEKGNNVSLVVSTDDEEKIDRLFARLSEGGKVIMPLGETFWSKKYGSLVDKYGINWMFNHFAENK
ncbi:VOC family protein [Enterococcus rivorum]|uniref:PhnB-like domain-containing protein n=1 Tax=Enterococcus rivorum TaxID=762845 RepID=A0A1E5KT39_9ENTE|nr:VOC family protein [Enterococcus rivorum]MBP2098091.1 PhnB protein [Enterococcus rivorum]OEH81030.1 hypothetical protein BCR26_05835 [Enterococcus rivorum]